MFKRKDGLWQEQITVTVDGRKKQKYFYAHKKAELLQKIQDYKNEQETGRTFESVCDEWWSMHQKTLAPNTLKGYLPAIRRAKDHFGPVYIRQILATDINRFLLDFIRASDAAQKTAKTQLGVINQVMKYAAQNGYISHNPAREISIPRGLRHEPREIISDADIKRVKESVSCTFGMFAYWILYTGCRRGELLALTWDDIDLTDRTIHISKSLYHVANQPKIKAPKSAAGRRTVPLMDKLLERIKPGKGLIFPDPDGGHMTEMHFQSLWKAYVSESGVSCTPHQIRHGYATMLYECGIEVKDAQELLGHAYATTTQDVYTHIREARKETVKNKLLSADLL